MLPDNKLKLILTLYKEDKITFEQFKELITDLPTIHSPSLGDWAYQKPYATYTTFGGGTVTSR